MVGGDAMRKNQWNHVYISIFFYSLHEKFSFLQILYCRVSENWHANIEKDEKQLTKSICILLDVEASGLGEVEVDWQIQQIYKWGQGGACGGRW